MRPGSEKYQRVLAAAAGEQKVKAFIQIPSRGLASLNLIPLETLALHSKSKSSPWARVDR